MIKVQPFKALRPDPRYVEKCAALPYDVMSSDEARELVKGNPYSFIHIDKAEVDLDPSIDIYDDRVYKKAKENLICFENNGVYINDTEPHYYVYRLIMDGRDQSGIVCCASIDDYINGKIKKHELTRVDKEIDRIKHVETCSAHSGPIFLTYKESAELDSLIDRIKSNDPLYDFITDDKIRHTIWRCDDSCTSDNITESFSKLDALYIADGHHRAASAVKVGIKKREQNPSYTGNEEFNYFLSVVFPSKSLKIFDYNRLIKDTNGYSVNELLNKISKELGHITKLSNGERRPKSKNNVTLYLDNCWYNIEFFKEICNSDIIQDRLDCSILQNYFLSPIMNINDPRTDKRIDFVGGIRGIDYLEKRCREDMKMAIVMYPTSIEELINIADIGGIMPPKSTWFEPKLRSGILIHKF